MQIINHPILLLQIYLAVAFLIGCSRSITKSAIVLFIGVAHIFISLFYFPVSTTGTIKDTIILITLALLSMLTITATIYIYTIIRKSINSFFNNQLEKEMLNLKNLQKQKSTIKNKITSLSAETREISSIYESINDMNQSLDLEDSVQVFIKAFNNLIDFGTGELIILGSDDKMTEAKRIYSLNIEHTDISTVKQNKTHEKILSAIAKENSMLFYHDKSLDAPINIAKEKLPDPIPLTIIPLKAEKTTVATLNITDLNPENLQKVLLLTPQFSMEIKKASFYEQVRELSWFDGLTGLYLNRYFSELAEDQLKRSIASDKSISFLMLDIDSFKQYNDQYGHLVGDIILEELAGILRNNAREFDIVGRYGGDEFIVVLPLADKKQAFYIAQRIKNEVEHHDVRIADDESVKISISIGIASYPEDGNTLRMLTDKADFALYRSKKLGKNVVTLFGNDSKKDID